MKILTPIGSKERFFEMFQKVNKSQLNEIEANIMQTGTQLVEKAFDELKNKQAQVKQTNTQTVDNENFVEIITVDETGKQITFTFKVNSNEGDQEGVFNVGGAVLTEFKIQSPTLNVEMPENMPAVQEFNKNHGSEIMDVVSEYADFETDTVSVDDEVYEEAVKFIDKIPYKKGSQEIQTHKNYADNKPTNPEVRVDADELQKFVKEMEDFVASAEEDDLLGLPPEASPADIAAAMPQGDDDGTTGVDPYDQEPDYDYGDEEASPEEQALFNQAYDNLVAVGNQAPTAVDIENEVNRLQGKVKPVEKTRAIPKGAEEFYESTDQDKYEDVVFMQGEEADEPLEILNNQGEDAAMEYLKQWHSPGQHMGSAELGQGSGDQSYEKDGYIMAWNFPLNYIGLQYELSGLDEETEKGDYPNPIGKKFKPKRQFPKKKKKITTDVKLSEESEIPQEYWGNPEDEIAETEEIPDEKPEDGDFIEGGKADDEDVSKYDPKEILMGIEIEMEHTDDPKVALEIAMDHLEELPDYYTRLKKMEAEAGVTDEGLVDNTPEDEEITDELLGFKPHNVSDYTNETINEDERFGNVTIHINGEGFIKNAVVEKIRKVLSGLMGERHLFIDDKEINPYLGEEFDYAAAERNYHDKEDMRQNPEDYEGGEEEEKEEMIDEARNDFPIGATVRISDGSGVDSNKTGVIVPRNEIKTDGRGTPTNVEGAYKPVDWNREVAVRLDDGGLITMFKNRVHLLDNVNEEDGFEEYAGEIGDRYQDANNNQFTVRNKVKGGVTLQGQGGEKEVGTSNLQFMKKLSETLGRHVVVFDGSSAYVESENNIPDDVDVLERFDDINKAQEFADKYNNSAYAITEEQVKIARQALNKRGLTEGMTKKEAVQILIKHNIK